ncbi:MAG: hypothetical protein LBH29_07735 [Elusimicrobiota bacterium]|nr:hypothetical protein [Elusimicrobiota bacterium]
MKEIDVFKERAGFGLSKTRPHYLSLPMVSLRRAQTHSAAAIHFYYKALTAFCRFLFKGKMDCARRK